MLLVLLVVLGVSACSESSSSEGGVEIGIAGSPVASYEKNEPWGTGDSAALEGVLVLLDDCLVMRGEDGSHVVAAFPGHFYWDAETQTLSGEGFSAAVGDQVVVGGGGGGPASSFPFVTLPEGCPTDSVFVAQSG
ncbi:hypothetical protein [Serinicoccus sp. LYQ131]|uniref:hypothetical protein n=1 Tax=Serinicoccus sp. LYQ131 TaxID=3378797 RepID=UPI003854CA47